MVTSTAADVGRAEAARVAGSVPAWWLHVDLDVLSTEAFSAVDYQQPGGLTWQQLEDLAHAVLSVPGCAGASVVIYNRDVDGGQAAPRIVEYAAFLLERAIGHS